MTLKNARIVILVCLCTLFFAVNGIAGGLWFNDCQYVVIPSNPLMLPYFADCDNATLFIETGTKGNYKSFGSCGTNPDTGQSCGAGIQSGKE